MTENILTPEEHTSLIQYLVEAPTQTGTSILEEINELNSDVGALDNDEPPSSKDIQSIKNKCDSIYSNVDELISTVFNSSISAAAQAYPHVSPPFESWFGGSSGFRSSGRGIEADANSFNTILQHYPVYSYEDVIPQFMKSHNRLNYYLPQFIECIFRATSSLPTQDTLALVKTTLFELLTPGILENEYRTPSVFLQIKYSNSDTKKSNLERLWFALDHFPSFTENSYINIAIHPNGNKIEAYFNAIETYPWKELIAKYPNTANSVKDLYIKCLKTLISKHMNASESNDFERRMLKTLALDGATKNTSITHAL